jgi:hypothetical protein
VPFLLKPELFKKMKAVESTKLMKQDITNAAGKEVEFVGALNVKVGTGEKTSLFALAEKPRDWQDALKGDPVIVGKCAIVKGPKLQVVVKKMTAGSVDAAVKVFNDAVADAKFEIVDEDKLKKEQEKADKIKKIVGDSYAKAGMKFEITDAQLLQFAKVSFKSAEFGKFNQGFQALARSYDLKGPGVEKLPLQIWGDLLRGLKKSGYIQGLYKAQEGSTFSILGESDDKTGKIIREKALEQGMQDLGVFTKHAETYLTKVVEKVRASGGDSWTFWSGWGAQQAALRENKKGVVLEGSIGKWFEETFDFPGLTGGVQSILLWAGMSELYAQTAARYYNAFKFKGYVGPTATRDQSVFNKIEQPTFIEIFKAKKRVNPPEVAWHVVNGEVKLNAAGTKYEWDSTERPAIAVASRSAALKMCADFEKQLQAAPPPK